MPVANKDNYQEALRYYNDALQTLSAIEIKNGIYTDRKSVKKAGRQAWNAVISALKYLFDEFGIDYSSYYKSGNQKRLTNKQLELKLRELAQKVGYDTVIGEIFNLYKDLYPNIHIGMGYDGVTYKKIIDVYMQALRDFLRKIRRAVRHKKDLLSKISETKSNSKKSTK